MLRGLVKDGLLDKEEARQILFSSETEEDRDKESLKQEIKFLRDLVEKLSNNNYSRTVEIIKEVEVPIYRSYPWWQPYQVWCGTNTTQDIRGVPLGVQNSTMRMAQVQQGVSANFSSIQTF